MSRIHSFPPVASSKSRVLILGSMPGEASLRAGQYYAHPRNAFWRIMGDLFGASRSLAYHERLTILDEVGIALWDVLQACVRLGSLDSAITDEIPNDFPAFFAKHPMITHVFFNGSKAEAAFRRYALPGLVEDRHSFARLPSTSPAHAAMALADKVRAWSVVKRVLSGQAEMGPMKFSRVRPLR